MAYSITQIGEMIRLDRCRVTRALPHSAPSIHWRPPWPPILDPFLFLIDQWLTRAPRLRASRIVRDLRTQYGFIRSYPLIQRLVMLLWALPAHEAYIRFKTVPSQQVRVNWSHEDPALVGTRTLACSLTPGAVHDGLAEDTHMASNEVLRAPYAVHLEQSMKHIPLLATILEAVWIKKSKLVPLRDEVVHQILTRAPRCY